MEAFTNVTKSSPDKFLPISPEKLFTELTTEVSIDVCIGNFIEVSTDISTEVSTESHRVLRKDLQRSHSKMTSTILEEGGDGKESVAVHVLAIGKAWQRVGGVSRNHENRWTSYLNLPKKSRCKNFFGDF